MDFRDEAGALECWLVRVRGRVQGIGYLAQMRRWLRSGLPAAMVDDLEVTKLRPPFPRFDQFERRPTE